jgi:AcrR family transcriptional regulator
MNAIPKILEPRWERRKDARPGELASAALELFIEKGFSATRLDDVAKRAGVSKGTLYLYFDSKEDLFKAVVREGIIPKFVEFEGEARTFTGSTPDLLRGLVHRWWDQIGATHLGGITKLMMSEAGNFPELAKFYHEEVITRGLGIFSAVIQRGVTRGEFRPLAMEYAPRICAAPVLMLMLWRHSFDLCGAQQLDPKAYLDTHVDMLVHSLSSNVHEPIVASEIRSATR